MRHWTQWVNLLPISVSSCFLKVGDLHKPLSSRWYICSTNVFGLYIFGLLEVLSVPSQSYVSLVRCLVSEVSCIAAPQHHHRLSKCFSLLIHLSNIAKRYPKVAQSSHYKLTVRHRKNPMHFSA